MCKRFTLALSLVAFGMVMPSAVVRAEDTDAWIKRWQQNADTASPTPIASLPPRQIAPAKKIPRSWIVGGLSVAAVAAALLLAFSSRAWRAANVFGRRYRFQVIAEKPMRLGAARCGGLIATAHFGPARRE